MDRHDVSESVTAENVAHLHQEDLKIQHKFGCRGLTYWFDEKRKTAFCLVEAPNAETVKKMHDFAHGEVPHHIIEVDPQVVESFLGRIEDPKKSDSDQLTIINDPAFRTIMVIHHKRLSITKRESESYYSSLLTYEKSLHSIIAQYTGRIVRRSIDGFLISFKSVSQALQCAISIHTDYTEKRLCMKNIIQSIGLCAGSPITDNTALFATTIRSAERFCQSRAHVTISSEIKNLYKKENLNAFVDNEQVLALSATDEQFIDDLTDYIEQVYTNLDIRIDDFSKEIGLSKSQFYRKMIELTGTSPITFLKDYRLKKALHLLEKHNHNISEIAYMTGYNSPSYFSKCFQKKYGVLPSELLQL